VSNKRLKVVTKQPHFPTFNVGIFSSKIPSSDDISLLLHKGLFSHSNQIHEYLYSWRVPDAVWKGNLVMIKIGKKPETF
jgi:hypothetical protein